MKKIKYILGFGVLGVLFGSCFGMTVIRESNSLDYGNHNSSIYYNQVSLTKHSNYGGNYVNNGFCKYTNFFDYSLDCNGLLNSSTFLNSSLISFSGFNTSWTCSYNGNSPSAGNSRFSIDSNHNIKYIVDDFVDNCGDDVSYHGELLFSNSGEFLGNGLDYYLSYIHLIGENYNKNPGFIQSNGKMDYYYFFGANNVYSKYGSYTDVPNGYDRRKFYDGFDFNSSSIIVSESNSSNFQFISSNPYSFSSISTSNGTQYNFGTTTYFGYLILSLGSYLDSFTVSNSLVLMLSGNNIYYNYFNTYSPYIETLSNTVVQSAGVLTTSSGNAYDLFSQFVNDEGYYFEVAGSYSSNNITIRSYKTGINHTYTDYVFGFSEDSSAPVIIPPFNTSPSSVYSGNVSLSTCVDTQICWDFTGSQGDIVRMCTTECVSTGVIASGGYIGSDGTYYFVNSPISIEDSLKTDNPENMFTGSYIDSGGILSLSYFTDYFQPGAKKVGVCPFQYYEGPLDFMTKLKVGDVYLLMPILCFYSAFQQGKNVTFFDDFDINDGLFSQPLIYGDTKNHKTLFAFFDVLFSIGLLGLIRYLSRHLF